MTGLFHTVNLGVITEPLTLSSLDSLCMSSLMGMLVCAWRFFPDGWFGKSTEARFLIDSSLDLKGTRDSWLMLGMAVPSNNEATLSWLANSTTAYIPYRRTPIQTMSCFK